MSRYNAVRSGFFSDRKVFLGSGTTLPETIERGMELIVPTRSCAVYEMEVWR